MGYLPNLVDIDGLCTELSIVTGISVDTVKYVVLIQFAKNVNGIIPFTDLTENIEKQLMEEHMVLHKSLK